MRRALLCLLLPAACLARPTVFHALDPVAQGDTCMLLGEDLEGVRAVSVAALDGPPGEPDAPVPSSLPFVAGPTPLQADARCVKFVMPVDDSRLAAVRLLGAGNPVSPVLLNAPAIWWLQGDDGPSATPGGTLHVCGKNLRGPHGAPTLLTLVGPQRRHLTADGDAYHAATTLPANLWPGDYQVYAHSQRGGALGWSRPLALTILPAGPVNRFVLDPLPLGVEPNSPRDQSPALQAALDRLGASGGGVLLLPRGRFRLDAGLTIPRGVTLRGAGAALTVLYLPETTKPPEAVLRGSDHFALEDFTLYCTNHRHIIAADLRGPTAGYVALRRLRVRGDAWRGHLEPKEVDARLTESLRLSSGGGDTVRLGGRNIEITDCDLYGSGRCLYLEKVRGGLVRGNRFYNGRWGWYCLSGSDGLIVEHNRITGADLMSTGGGLNCLDGSTYSQNVLFAHNELELMHGWDREAMTTDAGGACYLGAAAGAEGTKTLLAAETKAAGRDWAGAGLFILDGRGRGQWRRVVRVEPRAIVVDRPWDVAPDATSTLTCTMFQGHYLFIGNRFSDAGVALQLYGMACESICDGNTSTRTAGFHNFGMDYQGVQPSWLVQWLRNTIDEGNSYRSGHDNYMLTGEAHLGVFALPPRQDWSACLTLGCVVRGNRLLSNAHIAVGGSDPPNPALAQPVVQDVVVEHNLVRDSSVGIFVRRAQRGVLCRENTFERVETPERDEVAMLKAAAARRARLLAEPGPLVRYDCESFKLGELADTTGHGLLAHATGNVTTAPGRAGQALKLGGQSYLQVDEPDLFDLQALTLALWLKTAQVDGRHGLLAKRWNGAPAPFVLSLWDRGLEFEGTDVEGRWSFNFRTPALIKPNEWTHIAAVVEPGRGVTLYVNGQVAGTKENKLARVGNGEPLVIGREAWNGVNMQHEPCYYEGLLDDLSVWGRALTAAEIAALLK